MKTGYRRGNMIRALKRNNGNLRATAKDLKIPYSTLNYQLRAFGLFELSQKIRKEAKKKREARVRWWKRRRKASAQFLLFVDIMSQE